jgi:hypothetical protein
MLINDLIDFATCLTKRWTEAAINASIQYGSISSLLPSAMGASHLYNSAIAIAVDTVLSVKGKQAKNQFPPLKQR